MTKEKFIPKVAVITRTKDRPLLLERAIQSVHNQTMRDFIHVIINDGGDPRVVDELIQKYEDLIDGRVKVIHNKASHGMEAASNKAIKSVDSTFIAIHDDDDSWHPDFLKRTTQHLEGANTKGVVVTTDKIDEKIENNKVEIIEQSRWLPEVRTISLYGQLTENYATPITFVYRRDVYDEIGYYDESLAVAGDWDFTLRFLRQFDIDFLVTDEALAYYHHRPQSTGIDQNSVFLDSGLRHEQNITKIMNKYLRQDLNDGSLGLGYCLNSARSIQKQFNELKKSIKDTTDNNAVRIEHHINLISDDIMRKIPEESVGRSVVNRLRRK